MLTSGAVATVDDSDYAELSKHRWYPVPKGNTVYAATWIPQNNARGLDVSMHRMITCSLPGVLIDHKDRNGLNNTRANLRIATVSQNGINSKIRSDNTTGYKGVKKNKYGYVAQITVRGKDVSIGSYDTDVEAATAYNAEAIKYFGEFAMLNSVPDEITPIPRKNIGRQQNSRIGRSGFKGVTAVGRRWLAYVYQYGKRTNIGTFNLPQEAARAYDQKVIQMYGKRAAVNFPDAYELAGGFNKRVPSVGELIAEKQHA